MFAKVLGYGFTFGAVCFAVGFVGPILLNPTSGNGPLLGIFITGPVGFLAGIGYGVWQSASKRN